LAFVLIGVATPTDLIQDKRRSPFNVGRAIDLTGFQLHEAVPLSRGLLELGNSQALLQAILDWTGGQPFLTQKVCELARNTAVKVVPGEEAVWVEQLVRQKIIENWESQDEPPHLRPIRDRLLQGGEQRSGRLLGLCQQVVQQGEIPASDSPEQTQLRLSGLVVKREGKLRIYNRIYASVFNTAWFEQALTNVRSYAESLNAWVDSNREDESWLLRGQKLQDIRAWAKNKSLSDLDYQFLAASEDLDKRKTQSKAKQIVRIGFATTSLGILLGFIFTAVLPWLATFLSNRGLEKYYQGLATSQTGQMKDALQHYNVALILKPNSPVIYFNRGLVYEYLNDFNNASVNYETAKLNGLEHAYNNLARLYILQEKPTEAAELLGQGLKLVKTNRLKTAMLKNLGWAQFKQKQYINAESALRKSIALDYKQGSAHCLLAQVLEKQGKDALKEWQKCIEFGSPFPPEEKDWVEMAKQRLKTTD
jgi:tetratricopeptide (TPR) repeat protein